MQQKCSESIKDLKDSHDLNGNQNIRDRLQYFSCLAYTFQSHNALLSYFFSSVENSGMYLIKFSTGSKSPLSKTSACSKVIACPLLKSPVCHNQSSKRRWVIISYLENLMSRNRRYMKMTNL